MQKNSKHKIDKVLSTALNSINDSIGVDSIIGKPITCGSDVIIPVSKITACCLGGGGEYGEVKIFDKSKSHPFAGGSGAVVNVAPIGFLIGRNGKYEFVKSAPDIYDKIAEKTIDILDNISGGNINE